MTKTNKATKAKDAIDTAAEIAFDLYERKQITKDQLVEILQKCINARAAENGYAEEFGMPFPGGAPRT